jgi:hypothetical protein
MHISRNLSCAAMMTVVSLLSAAGQQSIFLRAADAAAIGALAGNEIYSATGLSVDRDGNAYVSDVLEYCVKKFDARGACVARVGRRGSGPAEFISPANSCLWNDTLLVLQVGDPRVQFFTRDLHYAGEVGVDAGMPIDVAVGPHGEMLVATLGESSGQTLLLYPRRGAGEHRRIALGPTGKKNLLYTACRIGWSPDGTILAAYVYLNRVDLCNADGTLRRTLTIAGLHDQDHDAPGVELPEETFFRGVAVDAHGLFYLLGGSRAQHPNAEVYVVSPKGVHRATVVLPQETRLLAVDARGNLFGAAEEGTLVKKYVMGIGGHP